MSSDYEVAKAESASKLARANAKLNRCRDRGNIRLSDLEMVRNDLTELVGEYGSALDELEQLRDEASRLRHDAKRCRAVYHHPLYGRHRCELPTHRSEEHHTGISGGWVKWSQAVEFVPPGLTALLEEAAERADAESDNRAAIEVVLKQIATFLDARDDSGSAETIAAVADGARKGERPGMYRRKLTRTMLRTVLAEFEQDRPRVTYLKPPEAAELLGLTVRTLLRWRKAGEGPAFVQEGRVVRYRSDVIEAWSLAARDEREAR